MIAFFLTLPLKATKLGLKTAIKSKELADKASGKSKDDASGSGRKRDSVLQRIRNRRRTRKGKGDSSKAMKVMYRTVQVLSKVVFFIRLCAMVLAVLLEVIVCILMLIMVLLSVSSVAIVMLLGADYLFSGRNWSQAVFGGGSSVSIGSSGGVNYANGSVMEALETVTKWYIEHIPTYQGDIRKGTDKPSKAATDWQDNYITINGESKRYGDLKRVEGRTYYPCDLLGSFDDGFEAGDDCSGFTATYIRFLLHNKNVVGNFSTANLCGTGDTHNALLQNGFICIDISKMVDKDGYPTFKLSDLVPGDIMVAYKEGSYGHAEIYVSPEETFGWGAARDTYWRKYSMTLGKQGGKWGLKMGSWKGLYRWIYRYTGGTGQ